MENKTFIKFEIDDDTPIQRIIVDEPQWTDESLDYYVPLMNARIAANRFEELIDLSQNDSLLVRLNQDEIIKFLGNKPENMKYLSFQEYKGTMNPEAISTFFKHGYCFNKDFEDITLEYEERFIIWFSGDNLILDQIEEWVSPLEETSVIALGNSSKSPVEDNQVRISVWRMIELL